MRNGRCEDSGTRSADFARRTGIGRLQNSTPVWRVLFAVIVPIMGLRGIEDVYGVFGIRSNVHGRRRYCAVAVTVV